ncbi:helix-turn-helix transcriptional regulator [Cupriavidus sp. 2SB]|uniref:helix-turn-helix transcriptional regulator n=1 Tax=Cupriavidus sp. 2SB TaxID=2502199 RepID=UPI0010FA3DA1|nr:helix-turn-helix transcriptional regulator [Cupriavidus sp. 2SB]
MKTTTYGERLEEALRLSGKDRQHLADAIGVTVQAISLVIGGKTKALNAENSARAARFTGVDAFWLATGVGSPESAGMPEDRWPFRASYKQYDRLTEAQKKSLEVILSEFIKSSLADRDDWGAPKPVGVIATANPTKRQKHG